MTDLSAPAPDGATPERPATAPIAFRLEYNGFEWEGTFQETLSTLLGSILQDGPFKATLILERWGGPVVRLVPSIVALDVTIINFDATYIYVEGVEGEDSYDRYLAVRGIEVR